MISKVNQKVLQQLQERAIRDRLENLEPSFSEEEVRALGAVLSDCARHNVEYPADPAPYPYNLLNDLRGEKMSLEEQEAVGIDQIQGLEYAMSQLSERQSDILIKRYRDQESLEELGEQYCLSPERVRQIEANALKTLRHFSRRQFWESGFSVVFNRLYEQQMQLRKQAMGEINKKVDLQVLGKLSDATDSKPGEIPIPERRIPVDISDLGLSVRAYNALVRAGIGTVKALCSLSDSRLRQINNLGTRSVNEIIDALDAYGFAHNFHKS